MKRFNTTFFSFKHFLNTRHIQRCDGGPRPQGTHNSQLQNYDYYTQWKCNKGTKEQLKENVYPQGGEVETIQGHSGHLCLPPEWLTCGREFMPTVLNKGDFYSN